MMRNMAGMMKKVQEMQSRMEALQQEMANTEFSAAVGSGAVQVTVTGKGEMRGVKIDPSAVDAEEISMLEDMILGRTSLLESLFARSAAEQQPATPPPAKQEQTALAVDGVPEFVQHGGAACIE